jgi:hypothetical protein
VEELRMALKVSFDPEQSPSTSEMIQASAKECEEYIKRATNDADF